MDGVQDPGCKGPEAVVTGEAKTYLFDVDDEKQMNKRAKSRLLQILPSLCAFLPCMIFGVMLGWPSTTFLKLLSTDAEIPITMNLTALIAGFLMIGNLFGTVFSIFKPFGQKFGIVVGNFPMVIGWILMWQAVDVTCILASRFFIGFGNGYTTVRAIEYVQQMCDPVIRMVILKFSYFFQMTGITIAYTVGAFLDFRTFSLFVTILSLSVFILTVFLPHAPVELLKFGKMEKAEEFIKNLRPEADVTLEVETLKCVIEVQDIGVWQVLKDRELFGKVTMLLVLVFFQQFSGPPSIVVYATLIFDKFNCPNPELFSIVYVLFYFLSLMFSSFYIDRFNAKLCLFITSLLSTFLLLSVALVIWYLPDQKWVYLKALITIVYITVHTFGLGFIPLSIAKRLFPLTATRTVSRIQVGFYSICAIVATKLFQLIITRHGLHFGFVYFSAISGFGAMFILIFFPYNLNSPT